MKVQITHADGAVEVWESHLARYETEAEETLGQGSMVKMERTVSLVLRGATQVVSPERAEPVYACGDRYRAVGREVRCTVPENEPHAVHRADHPLGAAAEITWWYFRPEEEETDEQRMDGKQQ